MAKSSTNTWLIAVVVLLAAGALWYYTDMKGKVGTTVTYACDANESFWLVSVDKDTVRLEGPGINSVALTENVAGYWMSADGKTVVKQVGSYVVLVQDDKVTHDRCQVASPGMEQ